MATPKLGKPQANSHRPLTRHEAALLGAPTSWRIGVDAGGVYTLLKSTRTKWSTGESADDWEEVTLTPEQYRKMRFRLEGFWDGTIKKVDAATAAASDGYVPAGSDNARREDEVRRYRDVLRLISMDPGVPFGLRRMAEDILRG